VLDADPADLAGLVGHRVQALGQLDRDRGARHGGHPFHLAQVHDRHHAGDRRCVGAASLQLVREPRVVGAAPEELGEPEVGLAQLHGLVAEVGLVGRRGRVALGVKRHPDRREAELACQPHELDGEAQIPLWQLVGATGLAAGLVAVSLGRVRARIPGAAHAEPV
jgi:hypothetical protein